jgi:hypothetical protein
MDLKETEARNDCAGEDQKQFYREPSLSSHELTVAIMSWLRLTESVASRQRRKQMIQFGSVTRQRLVKTEKIYRVL